MDQEILERDAKEILETQLGKTEHYNLPDSDEIILLRYKTIATINALLKPCFRSDFNEINAVYRCFLAQKLFEDQIADPVIPLVFNYFAEFIESISSEGLCNFEAINNKLEKFDDIIISFNDLAESASNGKFRRPRIIESKDSIHITCNQQMFNIFRERYDQLEKSFTPNKNYPYFGRLIYVLLARYNTIPAFNYQGTLPDNVFAVLASDVGCDCELFASPLNYTLPRYCSAYPDTDMPFGSLGNAFSSQIRDMLVNEGGSYEANPPFTEELIAVATEFFFDCLDASQAALSIVFIIPAWNDLYAVQKLRSSPYNVKLINIKENEHHYKNGSNHNIARTMKIKNETLVFILQNAAGKSKWRITNGLVNKLRNAFRKSNQ